MITTRNFTKKPLASRDSFPRACVITLGSRIPELLPFIAQIYPRIEIRFRIAPMILNVSEILKVLPKLARLLESS